MLQTVVYDDAGAAIGISRAEREESPSSSQLVSDVRKREDFQHPQQLIVPRPRSQALSKKRLEAVRREKNVPLNSWAVQSSSNSRPTAALPVLAGPELGPF